MFRLLIKVFATFPVVTVVVNSVLKLELEGMFPEFNY